MDILNDLLLQRMRHAAACPREMEALYRRDPAEFRRHFVSLEAGVVDPLVRQVWRERLQADEAEAGRLQLNAG